jgi:hypothetical protein
MSITLRIAVPPVSSRTWKTLPELLTHFTEGEVCEMCHRYCDGEDHRRRYRLARNARVKAMDALLTSQGIDTKTLV